MTAERLIAVLSFQAGYNTGAVMAAVTLLGIAAGLVGAFVILRRRALMGDMLAHATLPGIGIAFVVATGLGAAGRSLPVLLVGAVVTGVLGVLLVQAIRAHGRLPEDAAMGAVLAVFFGIGVVLLSWIQTLPTGDQGGIARFIYGQPATMTAADATLMAVMAAGCGLAVALLYKEFRLAAFDPDFGRAQGWPVGRIDLLLMTLLIAVTVVGLRAVGLILIVALVVIPPAAARFWTERLGLMVLLAGLFGGASAYLGAALSALLPDLPAGGVIVLVATALFVASLLLAPARGLLAHGLRRLALRWRIAREHLLRELLERGGGPLPLDALGQARAWPQPLVRLLARSLALGGLVHAVAPAALALTPAGRARAEALMRAHRLFEHYLVKVAGQPPVTADRGADLVEHALSAELLGALEGRLARTGRDAGWLAEPPSAHPLPGAGR